MLLSKQGHIYTSYAKLCNQSVIKFGNTYQVPVTYTSSFINYQQLEQLLKTNLWLPNQNQE